MLIDFFSAVPKKRKIKIRGGKGVLYNNLNFTKRTLFYATNFLFVFSLGYLLYLYLPLGKAVIKYWSIDKSEPAEEQAVIVIPTPATNNEYSLSIPAISASANIVPNINPFNKEDYLPVLNENSVAQAKGTQMPGSGKGTSTYIFAHSTEQGLSMVRKNSVFYLLSELKNDSEVSINYQGKSFKYRIYEQKIVGAREVEYLTYKDPDKEVLILQTCWPIGTDWKRLLVFGELIQN